MKFLDSNSLISYESLSDRVSQSSFDLGATTNDNSLTSNDINFKLSAVITSSGKSNTFFYMNKMFLIC